ncbi:hypothetical protein FisN_14Lh121 [Fistulifera solaris]|uniref:CBS domain-containing protein n=1 Tax=Fistulifera solaris TaxID=1519565 RepID=A0A1Z5J9E8_FISSO|nr:hypothetical protein FisN_14Lh121 [Fistulifera solaris]|eukprot:GAX10615.1 hypothetical protein FisN_14Lh121 [Fistulifera solaris]
MEESSMITPEGFGFSAPVRRILKESGRGYHKAKASDTVIDVMQAITVGAYDVALVYDEKELVGLFTETDYIRFSTQRSDQATTDKESAEYLLTAVREYVTPAAELLTLSPDQTANVAIATMKRDNIRHLLVADPVQNQKLTKDSSILGIISLQDVMGCIQKDERLSLQTLAQKYPNMSVLDQYREQIKSDANKAAADPETVKQDILKFGAAALFGAILLSFLTRVPLLEDYASSVMIGLFVLGYIGIIFEEVLEFNKAGIALLMSTGLWITYADFYTGDPNGIASEAVLEQLKDQLAEVSDVCFFLLAASAIVEVVDAHQGFKVVTNQIKTTSKKSLFWVIGILTFFLSSILNNLTVTIVMVSLLRKLIPSENDRRLFGAMVVVAANAGGVWTPIGDVTTTMLWINHQLSTIPTVTELFLPSFVCLVSSLAFLVGQVEEDGSLENAMTEATPLSPRGQLVFVSGIVSLLSVPVFAELTGLPPYLAMLTGLGAMWTLTDIIHMGEEDEGSEQLKLPAALERTDVAGILFFLGILMSIGVLDKSGLLKDLAVYLSDTLPSLDIIATVIGLASALIDNVPLVAATMGMYELADYGTDDRLWQLIALCAGTGGSILVIGSASGVALMGLEKVDFLWYAKKMLCYTDPICLLECYHKQR